MFSCKVVYGPDVEVLEQDTPIKVQDIKRSQDLKNSLGFGDNVNAMINGVTMPNDAIVPNDSTVVLETAANRKAREMELLAA